jgi:hypothetical protein
MRVFENKGLRRIFGSYREEVTGKWRKLCSEELSDLFISSNIIRVIKPRRKNWECHVHYWREERCIQDSGEEF